jgi:hypothetical protein
MNIDGVPKEMRNDETLVRLAKISPTMCSALPDDSVCHYSSLTSKTRLLLEYVECYITLSLKRSWAKHNLQKCGS